MLVRLCSRRTEVIENFFARLPIILVHFACPRQKQSNDISLDHHVSYSCFSHVCSCKKGQFELTYKRSYFRFQISKVNGTHSSASPKYTIRLSPGLLRSRRTVHLSICPRRPCKIHPECYRFEVAPRFTHAGFISRRPGRRVS